jgi:hypothetical protein
MIQTNEQSGVAIIAAYPDCEPRERALHRLHDDGFDMRDVPVIGRGFEAKELPYGVVTTGDTAQASAEVGAAAGFLSGLLIGTAFLVVPGVGPVLVAGSLTAALAGAIEGAVVGAVIGGLGGALVGSGMHSMHMQIYDAHLSDGRFLPQLIDNIAAEVFWGYCFRTDFQTAVNCVLRGELGRLWTVKDAQRNLREYDRQIARETVTRCYDETNAYMMRNASQAENIIGTLCVEDFARCRPTGFKHGRLLRQVQVGGDQDGEIKDSPPIAGELVLRTPLPAVLLLREQPTSNWIQPGSTAKALGFQKTMALMLRGLTALPSNPQGYRWGATGVFNIPCAQAAAPQWSKLIPNSWFSLVP